MIPLYWVKVADGYVGLGHLALDSDRSVSPYVATQEDLRRARRRSQGLLKRCSYGSRAWWCHQAVMAVPEKIVPSWPGLANLDRWLEGDKVTPELAALVVRALWGLDVQLRTGLDKEAALSFRRAAIEPRVEAWEAVLRAPAVVR